MKNAVLAPDPLKKYSYLDTPLIKFSDDTADWWTIREAVRGVQIFGGIGSGKTSGSGRTIAVKYLQSGFGGLVLCAKPGEAGEWLKYAEQTGRSEDVILFQEGSRYQFNALDYESKRTSKGGGLTFNLTDLFMTIFSIGQRIAGSSSEEKERFWDNSLKRFLNRTIDLLKLSGETLSVSNMVEVMNTTPPDKETLKVFQSPTVEKMDKLAEASFCVKCIANATKGIQSENAVRDFWHVYNYFLRDFPGLDEKVKSTIKEMFLGYAEPFLSGILSDHFAGKTNVTPEDTFEGKIVIMDFSVKDYLVSGVYAQSLFKHLWQQAVERRKVEDKTMPVFLWVDESQYFVNEYDTIFQTTARSSRACTVFLTQNISNYHSQLGGNGGTSRVNSLLGNLATMIFHANSDTATNDYASQLIGNALLNTASVSRNRDAHLPITTGRTESINSHYLPQVQPRVFTTLRSGGEEYDHEVDGIMVIAGREWSDGKNFNPVSFDQLILNP